MAISRVGGSVDVTTPAWLYESLPFVYLAASLLVFISLSGTLPTLSSILFFAAGVHVLLMRSRYRKSIRNPRRATVRSRR